MTPLVGILLAGIVIGGVGTIMYSTNQHQVYNESIEKADEIQRKIEKQEREIKGFVNEDGDIEIKSSYSDEVNFKKFFVLSDDGKTILREIDTEEKIDAHTERGIVLPSDVKEILKNARENKK